MDDPNLSGPYNGKSDRELFAVIELVKKLLGSRAKLRRIRERKRKDNQEHILDLVRWSGDGGADPKNMG
jgi:hypothetical protein